MWQKLVNRTANFKWAKIVTSYMQLYCTVLYTVQLINQSHIDLHCMYNVCECSLHMEKARKLKP